MKYTEQAVETLDDAGSVIANKNIEIEQLRQRVAELEENWRLSEIASAKRQMNVIKLTAERDALKQQRDVFLAALVDIQQVACSGSPELGIASDAIASVKERDELLAAKGKVSVTLTGKEIREIAELAGLQFVEHDYTDEYETEIAIESCPDKGILNDDNAPEHYRLIAFLNEYPEEGCIGLGEKIEASAPPSPA